MHNGSMIVIHRLPRSSAASGSHWKRLGQLASLLLVPAFALSATADPLLPVIPSGSFNILNYGGGTGVADNSTAIDSAVAAAVAAGGGTVIIPSGTFASSPLSFTANDINLEIDGTLQAPTRTNFGAAGNYISWSDANNIEISGSGTIDGQGATWWNIVDTRPRLVRFTDCQEVEVENITALNSPSFHFAFAGTTNNNFTFDHVTISAPSTSPNTDGIDPAGSNILIKNCNISDGDDNIAVKPQSSFCSNITITDCTFGSGHGVSVGGQTNLGLNGLTLTNSTFNGTTNGIRLKAGEGAGGLVENLAYSNITMNNVQNPIFITSWYINGGPQDPNPPSSAPSGLVDALTPIWENILFQNITSTNTSSGSNSGTIYGLPQAHVQNVTLDNVQISAHTGMQIDFADNVNVMDGTTITPAAGPVYIDLYQTTGSVPEPATLSMLLIPGLLLLRRRKGHASTRP